jgi:O-antigen/teichoic acid export membrane protein
MARNAGVQLLAKGGLLVITITTFSLLTHYLGPEQYGRYNLIISVFGMAAIIAELGLGTIAIREIATGTEKIGTVLPALLAVRIILSGLALATAVMIGGALAYDDELLRLILRGFGSGAFGLVSAAALQSWKNVIADTSESLTFLAIVVLGIANHRSIDWFVLGAVASATLGTTIVICLARPPEPIVWRVDWRYCRLLLREAAPLAISGLFAVVYFRLDALMLSKLSGEGAVGVYGVASKYVECASLVSTVFLSSLFPVLSYCFEHDRPKFRSYYGHALEWTVAFAFSLALFLYAFADPLVLLLSGAAFAEASAVLRICCGTIVLLFVNNIGVHLLFAARQQKHLVWINLIAVIAKFGVNLALIPRYGAEGAAVATVLTEMMIAISVFVAVRRLHGLASPFLLLGKLGAIALAAIGVLDQFHPDLAQRAMLMVGWAGILLLLGIPKPRQVLKLLQDARG